MTPPSPASQERAGEPTPGFTFADKRKIAPDGSPVSSAGGASAPPAGTAAAEPELGTGVADELAPPAGGLTAEEFRAQQQASEQLAAERLADLQRLQAEYANYRKRVDRDRATARDQAIASVIESLLPVLDDIHLARQHGDLEAGPLAGIADKLEATLAKYGVQRFGEPGAAFDPAVHDALMHVEEELAEGTEVTTVVGVLQPGYRIGDRVLRPARVSVADPR
ncbi:nucleotide exchange factor GrpE [Jatrophihabitans sp.]|uniref:nucleotide exchange factor GrpE n=1 Tax=Jatrophihabitans sp. TaxID=1932789 RepID=UPI002B83B77F|nr:nucleotide exchange factor GrpE [Jatrophihabitans sp.]